MPRPDSRFHLVFGKRLPRWSLLRVGLSLMALLLMALLLMSPTAWGATWYDYEFAASYWEACLNAQNGINPGSTPAAGLSATGSSNYIVSDLVQIDLSNPHPLVPTTGTHVLTTLYTNDAGYVRDGATNEVDIARDQSVWVTPGTTLYNQVVTTEGTASENMDLRTRQILGMPASSNADRIVEVWVKPGDMFRPARDPNMTTTTSPTEFTSAGEAYAHLPDAFKTDSAGNPIDANVAYQSYLDWLDAQVAAKYTINADGTTATDVPYPSTFMGYTYDWSKDGDSGSEIEGLSEYVIQGRPWDLGTGYEDTTVIVQGVFSTSSYAAIVRAADGLSIDGFNVTGKVDTIWAGETYYQIGTTRLITIQPGGSVEEGIEVVSDGYTIDNYGTISGPGKNFDPALHSGATYRESTIALVEGGIINNYGAIQGESLVIDAGTGATGTTVSIVNHGSIDANFAIPGCIAIQGLTGGITIENRGFILGSIVLDDATADSVTAIGGAIIGNVSFAGNAGDTFTFNSGAEVTSVMVGDIMGVPTVNVTSGIASYNGTIQNDLAVAENAGIEVCRTSLLSEFSGIMPDSPIVTVGGNLTLADATMSDPGATYTVHIYKSADTAMQSSQIQVGGTATLGIGSRINVDINQDSSAPIRPGEEYVVMTAVGGITDSGATYTTDSAFLGIDHWLTNGDTAAVIQLRQTTSFDSVAVGSNQKAAAAVLDSDHDVGSGSFAVMTNSLLFANAAEFQQSMNTLTPMPYFAIEKASRRLTQDLAAGLSDYLRGRRYYLRRYSGMVAGPTEEPVSKDEVRASINQVADDEYAFGQEATTVGYEANAAFGRDVVRPQNGGLWRGSLIRPFGTFFSQKATADQTGFNSDGSGMQITFDRAFSSQFLFGWELDYVSNSIKFDNSLGNGTLDMFRVGPYLTWFDSCKFFDLALSYGYNDNTITRNASYVGHTTYARRNFDAHDVSVYMGTGRDYNWYNNTFTPEMSLQYVYYGRDRFTEQEAAGSAVRMSSYGGDSLRMMIGARFSRLFLSGNDRLFVPEVNAGWAHEFLGDDSMEARFAGGVTPFTITPGGIYRDSLYYGASLTFVPRENLTLAGRYRGEITDGGPFHACELSLTWGY